jgi:murein DD-endopeptidase MepM/ murein hydrolase activator NlpD
MPKVLFQPVKPFIVSQPFGDNRICISLDGTNKIINCDGHNPPVGYESLYGEKGHLGCDLVAKHNQEVYAAQSGKVYKIDTNPKTGLDVRIEHNEAGLKLRTIYEHLLGYQPKVGQYVEVGELIGWADNTGYSSGNHLHLQMELWNGTTWVPVDPMLYMSDQFAPDFLRQWNQVKYIKQSVAKLLERFAYNLRT